MNAAINQTPWWRAEKGKVHCATFEEARRIETENGDVFDRFVKSETLYDPNTPDDDGAAGNVTENVIATGVDTLAAMIGVADIWARFLTDGADWGQSRRAKELEFYAEERVTDCKILQRCRSAAKEALKKGMGLTKSTERFGKPHVELVAIENIVVDPAEHRDGRETMQIHQWDYVDAEVLTARFPKYKAEIEMARGRGGQWWLSRGNWRMPAHQVLVLYSWRVAFGEKGTDSYVPGREVLCIDGADLFDRKWDGTEVGEVFAMFVFSERLKSFYPISAVERVMGIQRALNRRTSQIERILDQNAVITSWFRPADANVTVKTSALGRHGIIRGDWPVTPAPPVVHPETYQDKAVLRATGLEEFAVNQMAARGSKPAGIETGRAIRELRDATSQRYAPQEQSYEEFVLATIWNTLMVCKRLGNKAPTTIRRGRFAPTKLRWKDVDPTEMRIQMRASSNSPRQPWGRTETALELAQAGLVSTDSARRMLDHLDLDQELSLYMAALESIECDFDAIAKGHVVVPQPFTNAAMAVWRANAEYLKWEVMPKTPEEVLEVMRQYIELAADVVAKATEAANSNMPPVDPAQPQPVAALAPDVAPMLAS